MFKLGSLFGLVILVVCAVVVHCKLLQQSSDIFLYGVSSHEVTNSSVILWTRVNVTNLNSSGNSNYQLSVQVATDSNFQNVEQTIPVNLSNVNASHDYTIAVPVTNLTQPFTNYWYRFVVSSNGSGSASNIYSAVGKFKTAPLDSDKSDTIRFVFTGDADGATSSDSNEAGSFYRHDFEVMKAAANENPDFFLFIGDTMYADSGPREQEDNIPSASTQNEYWNLYKLNRVNDNHKSLLQNTVTYAQWDDHEIQDNWNSLNPNKTLIDFGIHAFHDYYPLANTSGKSLYSPGCVQEPQYRTFKYGSNIELFILDERSCRTMEVEVNKACTVGTVDLSSGPYEVQYLYPLVPQQYQDQLTPNILEVIKRLGNFNDNAFNSNQPASQACLDALNSSNRSMLGQAQKEQFLSDLKASNATFKIVVNEVPMQHLLLYPYDRWEGFPVERAEILNFIKNENISNVFFATTDLHMNVLNSVYVDIFDSNGNRISSPQAVATEAVVGPIAMLTPLSLVRFEVGGFLNIFLKDLVYEVANEIRRLVPPVTCMNLDTFSYGSVQVTPSSFQLQVKDYNGNIVNDDNDSSKRCELTLQA